MYIHIKIEIVWLIKGYDNYGFGKDKRLYNLQRCKPIKQIFNNSTIGYILNKKFISLKQLKQLLYKPTKSKTPF